MVRAECKARTGGGDADGAGQSTGGRQKRWRRWWTEGGAGAWEGKSPFVEVAAPFWEFWGTMELGALGDRGEVEGEDVPLHQKQISYKRK